VNVRPSDRPRRLVRRGHAFGVLVAALLLTGCGDSFLPEPVTEQGERTADLWRVFLWVAAIVGLIVYGLVVFVVIRYRRRKRDDGRAPSQRQDLVRLEVLWTAIPFLIVAVLYGLSLVVENDVTEVSKDPDLVVEIRGFQWQWQFTYPDSGIRVTGVPGKPPTLVLPTERTIRLELVADDVIHSFWVPNFIEKRDLIPGVDNHIDVNLTKTGEWSGVCSEFCGLDHWKMNFSVQAMSPADFDAWLAAGGTG
jgi:cytochrome c oxidase subunit 2